MYVSAWTTPSDASTGSRSPTRIDAPGRQRPGRGGEEADREGLLEAGQRKVVGDLLAEGLTHCDLDDVHPDRMPHEVSHLPAGDASRHLDDHDAPVGRRDELRERDPVAEAERADGVHGDLAGAGELLVRDRRREDVDPADAEPDAGRAQSVGERQEQRLTAPHDDDAVQLDPVHELLEDRDARRRLVGRLREVALELLLALDAEHGALAAGVGGLEHCGKRDDGECQGTLSSDWIAANGGCGTPASANTRRISSLCVIRCAVSRPIPGSSSASATAATTGTARSAATVSTPSTSCAAADLDHARDVGEVDELADVRRQEPERFRVAVDRDDLVPELLHALDRTALVTAAADEEDGRHRVPSALPQVASEPLRR